MKKKNGFVFLESVIVLVVVALALTGFLITYTVLSNNSRRKEHYDNTSDKYLLYAISSLGTTGNNNFTSCGGDFSINIDTAYNSCISNRFYDNYTDEHGNQMYEINNMFNDTGLVYLYYIDGDGLATKLQASSNPTTKYDNGTIEYMKTLDINKTNYLIGVFKRSDKFYYASINL